MGSVEALRARGKSPVLIIAAPSAFLLSLLCALVAQAGPHDEFIALQRGHHALTNVELYDGTGAPPVPKATILVREGRIAAAGPTGSIEIPKEATVKDLEGHSISPGFVMLHEHTFYPVSSKAYGSLFHTFPRLYIAGGATTIRTAGSMSPYADLNLKRDIAAGLAFGPDMDVTAPFINGDAAFVPQVHRLTTPEGAREMVRYWASEGATSYKTYMHLTRAQLGAAIEEAHRHRHKVTGHLCSVTYREAADLGIDNLEHGFLAASDFVKDKVPDQCPPAQAVGTALNELAADSAEMRSLQEHLIARKVALTSTLTIFETFATGRPIAPQGALELLIPELREIYLTRWSKIAAEQNNAWTQLLPKAMRWEKQFSDAGGLLVAGTDPTGYGGVVPGFSNVRQIELLEEAGFSRSQALRVATLNGALYLGRDAEIGSVAVGKRADLVLFKGRLSEDPKALRQIVWTMKDGIAYDAVRILASLKGKVGLD